MAITVAKIGQVDPSTLGGSGQPLDLQAWEVDITLGATGDYGATGIDLTNALLIGSGGINVSQVVQVAQADVRTSGNVIRPLVARFDQASKTLRLYRDSGILFSNAVQLVGTAATETAPLAGNAFTLPANTLAANGMGLRATFWGTKTTAAEAGTIRVNLGGTVANPPVGGTVLGALVTTGNGVAQHWRVTVEMIRRTSATESIIFAGVAASDATATLTDKVSDAKFTAGAADLTTALTLLPTINSTTGTTCTLEGQLVEVFGPGTSGAQALEIVPATDLAAGDIVRCLLICV